MRHAFLVAILAATFTACKESSADLALNVVAAGSDRLIVHEWGTFTELQDFAGTSLNGINTDDEPVPRFVHGFGPRVLAPTVGQWRMKGLPAGPLKSTVVGSLSIGMKFDQVWPARMPPTDP